MLQEEFVTIRNERFVVPVIAGQRRKLDGVIHGASSSGHTLFVEPLETIDLNNELVRLAEEEAREVHRILLRDDRPRCAATAIPSARRLRHHGGAGADLRQGAASPPISTAPFRASASACCLRDARHPLLEDVLRRRANGRADHPGADARAPHAADQRPQYRRQDGHPEDRRPARLMAQSGLPVPAAEAEFPLFEQVLADIGDYQSIQENLSTFSAHVSHIREMALDVTPDSLVLLDELGAATDPGRRRRAGRGHRGAFPRRRAPLRWSPRT